MCSLVGRLALSYIVSVVKPVDFLNQLVSLGAETDRFYVEISEAFVQGVTNQFLGFSCHELRIEPSSKHLSVERLPPVIMVVLVSVLKFNGSGVWFDLGDIKEHLVYLLVSVDVWATKVVGLSNSFFHLQTVHDCECDISNVHGLHFGIHSFDLPVHAVEHLHLHAPLGSDSWVLM